MITEASIELKKQTTILSFLKVQALLVPIIQP